MLFNRYFYKHNEKAIELVASKIKSLYFELRALELQNSNSKLSDERVKELCKSAGDYAEGNAVYTIFQNSYDPRAGYTLAVYVEDIVKNINEFKEIFKKHFGEFNIRGKEDCKKSNYRTFTKDALDFVCVNEIDYKLSLNVIFNGNYVSDNKKHLKYLSKAPKGIKY